VSLAVVALLGLLVGCADSSGGSSLSGSTVSAVTSTGGGSLTVAPVISQTTILTSGTFRLLTYNVAGLPQALSGSNPATNTIQISPLLNTYDLVVVQEDFIYHTDLQRNAAHLYQSLPLARFTALVNDGLNRFSRSSFVNHVRQKWIACNGLWNDSNDCLSSKGFAVARHQFAPGVEVDVYNLHADAGRRVADQNARTAQFAQLDVFMDSYSNGRAVIVAGDSNLKTQIPDDERVLNDFMGAQTLELAATVLGSFPDHIDRVFFRSSADVRLTPVLWRVADEFVDSGGADLSDHTAINVDFEYQQLR